MAFPSLPCEHEVLAELRKAGVAYPDAELEPIVVACCAFSSPLHAAAFIYQCIAWRIAREKLAAADLDLSEEELAQLESLHRKGDRKGFADKARAFREARTAATGDTAIANKVVAMRATARWEEWLDQIKAQGELAPLREEELFCELVVALASVEEASNMAAELRSRPQVLGKKL